jgi:hypothetical protein
MTDYKDEKIPSKFIGFVLFIFIMVFTLGLMIAIRRC